mmetsp:Transcript_37342/g.106856  ORF Transcript_37342/g.106856 Transcript_37342/m.106856 type:complete len:83 (-) Transcript_37342:772-1020(-)
MCVWVAAGRLAASVSRERGGQTDQIRCEVNSFTNSAASQSGLSHTDRQTDTDRQTQRVDTLKGRVNPYTSPFAIHTTHEWDQ